MLSSQIRHVPPIRLVSQNHLKLSFMKINTLHTEKIEHSDFDNLIDHLFIDGVQLNDLITNNGLNYNAKFLLPTISCEIRSSWDREYIWSLLNDKKNKELYFPILMCVEGDLGCLEHIVFVHIAYAADFVYWKKFGVLSNAKKYTTVLDEKSSQRMEVCSKTVDSIKLEEIDWFEKGKIYKFDKKKYDYLIAYYRSTNEERIMIEKIIDWLLGFKVKKAKEYLYISVASKKEISLSGSNKMIDNWSEWLNESRGKPMKNKLKLSGRYELLTSEKIVELIKIAVVETNKYVGENVIRYAAIIFIGDDKGELMSIKNKKIEKAKRWWNDWQPEVKKI